ncbi:MAG: response regulator transcription factor [Puniceicoccales bacterium]|jgi:DNA-binding NarL/FixJ family response regulator|nr:response regulator transcription factor [Puniceicoccales bacterium]
MQICTAAWFLLPTILNHFAYDNLIAVDMPGRKQSLKSKSDSEASLALARSRLTRSRYVTPEDFAVRIPNPDAPQDSSVLFPLNTIDESVALERAVNISQDLEKHGWNWVFQNHPREIIVGFAWNQNPAFATYTTLVTRPERAHEVIPATENSTGVLLIVPNAVLRQTMEAWVNSLPGIHCAFVFESIEESLNNLPEWQNQATFALCDCGLWGVPERFSRIVDALSQHVPVVPMTFANLSETIFLQMTGSCYGYMLRRTLPADALEPIRGVEAQPEAWGDSIRRYYVSLWHNNHAGTGHQPESGIPKEFTPRETEILQAISEGLLNKEIAARLKISANTVRNHIAKIFQKIGIGTRAEAVAWYLNR